MDQKFFVCSKCKKIVAVVKDSDATMMCCEQDMKEIIPGTTDAAAEKHIPVYTVEGNTVKVVVGSVEHPMMEKHYIEWISVQTKQGNQTKYLSSNMAPKAEFALCDGDAVEAVYAYCNLHGLWKA